MNRLLFRIIKQGNRSLRKFVNNTTNYKMISRLYAEKYNKIQINEDIIVYETRDGQNFSDSPLQMFKYLVNHKEYESKRHFIVYQNAYIKEILLGLQVNGIDIETNDNVFLVERNTPSYIETLLSAKYLITDSTFQSFFVKKSKQVYINTWHGTPLKLMGYAMSEGAFGSWNVVRNFLMSDYLISPNNHTSEIFLKDYRLNGIYTGEILEVGYPRNDVFFENNGQQYLKKYLYDEYEIDNKKKLLIYAPTWKPTDLRQNRIEVATQYLDEYNQLLSDLGDQYHILMKLHPFVYRRLRRNTDIMRVTISDGIDANELLSLADLLITDFSSIFFDFLVTNKPIVFFNQNSEVYEQERGYYLQLDELPGPFFSDINQMTSFIKVGKFDNYFDKYEKFKQKFVSYDDGNVSERTIKRVWSQSSSAQIIRATNDKKKVLLYTGGLQKNGISAAFINLVNSIDTDIYDISLLTMDQRGNQAYYSNFQQLPEEIRVFVIKGESTYGILKLFGKYIAEKYSYNPLLRFLYSKKQAELNSRRLLGNQKFDVAIDFDSYVMDNGQWIASSDAKHTYNILHNDMWLEANKKVNGKLKNPKTKRYVPFWKLFETSLSVSDATKKINDKKLRKYINNSGVLTNIIDNERILNLSNQEAYYKPIRIDNTDETIDITNSSILTKATFGDIDESLKQQSIGTANQQNAARIFITNSRLSPEKNLDNLILAFVQLHRQYPSVQLQIFGQDVGQYAPILYKLVQDNHAQDYIKFFGYSDNTFPAVSAADVFLLPSHTEGQSIALMEAMVLHKNIMASNILANIELLKNGQYGLLTEGNDLEALYKGLAIFAEGKYNRIADFDAAEHNKLVMDQFDSLFD